MCGQVHANEMESYYLRVYGYGVSLFYMGDAQAVTAPAHIGLLDPPSRSLDANLYMQWSAEYRACCHQTFFMAAQRVREKVGGLPEPSKPYAVVLDLDETVLDNSVFQSRMLMQNHGFSQAEWDVWEQKHYDEVSLVPGAKKFIEDVQGLSVTIVYVSNRSEKYREETKCVLNRFGLPLESDACLCLASGSSDKTSRRMVTDCGFTVLLLIGDNLRDFDEQFKIESHSDDVGSQPRIKSALLRADKVDRTANRFGEDWFILPNPAYGEWTKVFRGNGADLGFLREVAPVE